MSATQSSDVEKITAWAMLQVASAVSSADLGASRSFQWEHWGERRSSAAAMACTAVRAGLAELVRSGAIAEPPDPSFDEEAWEKRQLGAKTGHVWGQLVLGSIRRSFWPVNRKTTPWETEEDFAPSMKGPGVAEHWALRAITALAGRAALALIARRTAVDMIEQWVRQELAASTSDEWGTHLRSAWECAQIGSTVLPTLKKRGLGRAL